MDALPDLPPLAEPAPKGKRRLLYVTAWMEPGGADKFNLDALAQLTSAGWDVTLVTTVVARNAWRAEYARYTDDIHVREPSSSLLDFPSRLREIIHSRRIDLVLITHSELGYLLVPYLRAHFPDLPMVDYCHMEAEFWKGGGYPRISLEYQRQLDGTIVSSEHLKRWMVDRGAQANRVDVCYTNVDTKIWRPDVQRRERIRKELGLRDEEAVILYAGRLCPQKQPQVFAAAMKRLAAKRVGFRALVAGDGEQRIWLEDFLATNHLTQCVQVLGEVSNERMRNLMAAADIFFLPSQWEGISLAIYEAMASGLAVVGADVGGQRELATFDCAILLPQTGWRRPRQCFLQTGWRPGGTGSASVFFGSAAGWRRLRQCLLRERAEGRQYANAIAALVGDPNRCREMGERARQRVERHFPIDAMGERLCHLLDLAAERRSGQPGPQVDAANWNRFVAQFLGLASRQPGANTMTASVVRAGLMKAVLRPSRTPHPFPSPLSTGARGAAATVVAHATAQQNETVSPELSSAHPFPSPLSTEARGAAATVVAHATAQQNETVSPELSSAHARVAIAPSFQRAKARLNVELTLAARRWLPSLVKTLVKSAIRGKAAPISEAESPARKPLPVRVEQAVAWNADEPLVSIVIPCYNYGRFLPEAIESAARQTFCDLEILVVNDGSTAEETLRTLWGLQGPNLVVLHQPNRGLAQARNQGIARARGKYVCCLDADDRLEATYLEKAVTLLELNPGLAIAYSWMRIFGDEEGLWKTKPFDLARLMSCNLLPVSAVFRKDSWKQVGGYRDGGGFEDWEFWLQLGAAGFRGQVIPEPLFEYRRHGRTMAHEAEQKRQRLVAQIWRRTIELFGDRQSVARIERRYYDRRPDRPFANLSRPEQYDRSFDDVLLTTSGTLDGAEVASEEAPALVVMEGSRARVYALRHYVPAELWEEYLLHFIETRGVDKLFVESAPSVRPLVEAITRRSGHLPIVWLSPREIGDRVDQAARRPRRRSDELNARSFESRVAS